MKMLYNLPEAGSMNDSTQGYVDDRVELEAILGIHKSVEAA